MPYEAPQGRRVNVVGALAPYDPAGPRLVFETRRKTQGPYDAAAHLRFVAHGVAGLPETPAPGFQRARPCVVVVDNYSVHHSKAVKAAIPALETAGVRFVYLPPYSPKLNPIEPVWRHIKHDDLPIRSHATDRDLQTAVEAALTARASRLHKSQNDFPRPT